MTSPGDENPLAKALSARVFRRLRSPEERSQSATPEDDRLDSTSPPSPKEGKTLGVIYRTSDRSDPDTKR